MVVVVRQGCCSYTTHFLFIPPNEDLTQNKMELFDGKIAHNKHTINHSDNKQESYPGMKKK